MASVVGSLFDKNCYQAVREIIEMVQYRKTNYVVEADIRGFFDNVDHEWLMKMLSHDIADKRFLEIIGKFLKAGIMENGEYYLIRYCDDFVCCFQNKYEAEAFKQKLEERFRKYGLELAEWTGRSSFSVVG